MEIQLASTQIPIIVAREQFYATEARHLLWLTWNFDPTSDVPMRATIEDVFFSHRGNLFSMDAGAAERSRAERLLHLRVFWLQCGAWHSALFALSDLYWPESGIPFAVPSPAPWVADFLKKWRQETDHTGQSFEARKALLGELASRFEAPELASSINLDVDEVVNLMLSFEEGRPVASRQKNLVELSNTFLGIDRRRRFANLFSRAASVMAPDVLERVAVRGKIEAALQLPQETARDPVGRAVAALFPHCFRRTRGRELKRHSASAQ